MAAINSSMHCKNILFVCWFLLTLGWNVTTADDDPDVLECRTETSTYSIKLCYAASQYQIDANVVCPHSHDILQVTGIFLYRPKIDKNLSHCEENLGFKYQKPFDVSCYMKTNPKMKNLAQQIVEGMNWKTKENINVSLVAEKLNHGNLSTLPEFPPYTILGVTYKCFDKKGAPPMVDMCESSNKTYTGESVHLVFDPINFTPPTNVSSSSGCSCTIKRSEESIEINLIDVRLEEDTVLSINDSNNKRGLVNSPFWLAQGEDFFKSSAAAVQVELSKINPSRLPQSVWLELKGNYLTITCGSVISKKANSSGREFAFLYLLAIIPAALVVFLIIVCVVQVKKRCNKMKYKVVDKGTLPSNAKSGLENDYHSDSKGKNSSNTYVEVEPDYNELDESSSVKHGLIAEGKETTQFKISADLHSKPKENGDNSLYNHLRETNITKSDVNLYDTAEGDDYSTLHRKKDEEIIDNVYSTTLT